MSERVEVYRRNQLEMLAGVFDRTGMYAPTAGEATVMCEGILHGLAFLDGRDEGWVEAREKLRGRMDKYGIPGIGRWFEVPGGTAQPNVLAASLFAEIAHRLGYLEGVALLDDDDWERLRLEEHVFYSAHDHRMQELGDLPMPSAGQPGAMHTPTGAPGCTSTSSWRSAQIEIRDFEMCAFRDRRHASTSS